MYYSLATTNENHVYMATPYLCLKSRLLQCLVNRWLIYLLFCFLFMEICDVWSKQYTTPLLFNKKISISDYSNSVTLVNQLKDERIKSLNSTIWNVVGHTNNVSETLAKNQINLINITIETALSLKPRISTVSFTLQFSTFQKDHTDRLEKSSSFMTTSLNRQNVSIVKMANNIKQQALSFNSNLDYSDFKINFSWINPEFANLNQTFIKDLKVLRNNVTDISNKNRINFTLFDEIKKLNDTSQSTYKSIYNIQNSFRNKTTTLSANILSSLKQLHDFLYNQFENYKTVQSKSTDKVILKHHIVFAVMALMIICCNVVLEYVQFQYEQFYSKRMSHDMEQTENHLAIAHHVLNPFSNIFAEFLITIAKKFQYAKGKYLENEKEVYIHWLSYWVFSKQSHIMDWLVFTGILLLTYMFSVDVFNDASQIVNSAVENVDTFSMSRGMFINSIANYENGLFVELSKIVNAFHANITSLVKLQQHEYTLLLDSYTSTSLLSLARSPIIDSTLQTLQNHPDASLYMLNGHNLSLVYMAQAMLKRPENTHIAPFNFQAITKLLIYITLGSVLIFGIYLIVGSGYTIYHCFKKHSNTKL